MKRLLVVLLLALIVSLAVGVGVANATHSPSDNPSQDFAVGGGRITDETHIAIAALSDPSGEDPRGHLMVDTPEESLQAPVTCFITTVNRAVAGGPDQQQPGSFLYIIVEDNDVPGDDRATFTTSAVPANEAGCALIDTLVGGALLPLEGNVIVHDATL